MRELEIDRSWKELLKEEMERDYFYQLLDYVGDEYENHMVYPPKKLIFNAFNLCSLEDVKVVILGQDPYHGDGQAHGLSFSVPDGMKFPPSLRNIFKELSQDVGVQVPMSGNLERWASQGVLLLNATLTVRRKSPGSHQNKGWEQFTDRIIQLISELRNDVVFILWGSFAQQKEQLIDHEKHLILKAAHPSPFSAHRGFFGSKHFSSANEFLKSKGEKEINW